MTTKSEVIGKKIVADSLWRTFATTISCWIDVLGGVRMTSRPPLRHNNTPFSNIVANQFVYLSTTGYTFIVMPAISIFLCLIILVSVYCLYPNNNFSTLSVPKKHIKTTTINENATEESK